MNHEEVVINIVENKKEIGLLKHRVDELEEKNDTIQELVISVKELAMNMQAMIKEQERYAKGQERAFKRIETLESAPAKHWNTLITVIITALASGVITYILSNVL